MRRGDSGSHEPPRSFRQENGSESENVPQLRRGRGRWLMGHVSGTFPAKEMGHREVGNLPIELASSRAVMILGMVVMFVVAAVRRQHLFPPNGLKRREETYMI